MEEVKPKSIDTVALEECEKSKPSADPAYWAKRSCTRCFGRGVEGAFLVKVETNVMRNEKICSCADRRFGKWRKLWVENWKKLNSGLANSEAEKNVQP